MRIPIFSLALGKGFLLNQLPVTVTGFPDGVSVELTRADTNQKLVYSRNALARLAMRRAFSSTDNPIEPEESGRPLIDLSKLSEKELADVKRRLSYTKPLARMAPISPKSAAFRIAIEQVAQHIEDPTPPSPHSVYRWLLLYIDSGQNPDIFAGNARIRQRRKSRLPEGVHEALEEALIETMGQNPNATLYGAFNAVIARVAAEKGFDAYRTVEGPISLSGGPLPVIIQHRASRKPRKSLPNKSPRNKP